MLLQAWIALPLNYASWKSPCKVWEKLFGADDSEPETPEQL